MGRPILNAVASAGALLLLVALPAGAGETVIDVNVRAAAKLPSGGVGVKQVSGLEVSVGADGSFTAPSEVCTLIFQQGDERTVVRVCENKDRRYFVSYANGDDTTVSTGRENLCRLQYNPTPEGLKARNLGPMTDVTQILSAIEQGDPSAADQLLPLVYDELRKLAAAKMAQEAPGQTLQATALVHEAYVRLVDVDKARRWDSRGHFFAAAAEAMHRILIDRARDKRRVKRGGGLRRLDLQAVNLAVNSPDEALLDLDDALQKLAREDPLSANLVKLRLFAGLTLREASSALGLAARTADRYWAFARAWLYEELREQE